MNKLDWSFLLSINGLLLSMWKIKWEGSAKKDSNLTYGFSLLDVHSSVLIPGLVCHETLGKCQG